MHACNKTQSLCIATVPPRDLRNFILTLGEQWVEIAKYLGFSDEEIAAIVDNYPDSIAKQVSALLQSHIAPSRFLYTHENSYMYIYVLVSSMWNAGGLIPGEVEDARLWPEDTSSHAQTEGTGWHCGAKERQSMQ